MKNDTLALELNPQEAVFFAGGAILLLSKGIRSADDNSYDRFTQLLGLSLLNRLADQAVLNINDSEVIDALNAAVETAMSLTDEKGEVLASEIMDGISTQDAKKLM